MSLKNRQTRSFPSNGLILLQYVSIDAVFPWIVYLHNFLSKVRTIQKRIHEEYTI